MFVDAAVDSTLLFLRRGRLKTSGEHNKEFEQSELLKGKNRERVGGLGRGGAD